MKPLLILGTSAPHRRSIAVQHLGDEYDIISISPDIDEKEFRSTDAYELTRHIAEDKMLAVLEKVKLNPSLLHDVSARAGSVAVTFDQVVVWKGEIREKPSSAEEAYRFIKSYSNSSLDTVQTTAVHSFALGKTLTESNKTTTYYNDLCAEDIHRVVSRGVCLHTAGAFVVEDADMAKNMESIDPGSQEEVQGFCISAVRSLLAKLTL